MENPKNSAIWLTVDRLHIGFLGPYGNAWIETPTLNALASRAVVFDRFYVSSLKEGSAARTFAVQPDFRLGFLEGLHESGVSTLLLTDDPELFQAGDLFGERFLIDIPERVHPVRDREQTHFFRMIAELVALAERHENNRFFLWTHLSGLGKTWDCPPAYRERYREEDDPAPHGGATPPFLDCRRLREEEVDPDEIQSIVETYAGMISLFDESLGGLLESLEEKERKTLFLLHSMRGIPMGEHRVAGSFADPQEEASHGYSEMTHLPLFLRFPDTAGSACRSSALACLDAIPATLSEWFQVDGYPDGNPGVLPHAEQPAPRFQSLLPVASGEKEMLCDALSIDETVLVTPDWLLCRGASDAVELYKKPDDRWEVNDVARRCREIVEELSPLLGGSSKTD